MHTPCGMTQNLLLLPKIDSPLWHSALPPVPVTSASTAILLGHKTAGLAQRRIHIVAYIDYGDNRNKHKHTHTYTHTNTYTHADISAKNSASLRSMNEVAIHSNSKAKATAHRTSSTRAFASVGERIED